MKASIRSCDIVQRGVPILRWLPEYTAEKALSDLVSGITIGLTLIPQSMAYAGLAGVGPQYGLYASLCGGLIYTIFGTIPQLNIAPTALLSLLTFSYTHHATFGPINAAVLLCFLSGLIESICGLLHLGFLVDFVSTPVVAGFTAAGAITIASAQVKNMFGLKYSAENFIEVWMNVFANIHETKTWDAVLSVCCCVTLLGLRSLKDFGVAPLSTDKNNLNEEGTVIKKLIWFASVSRNATVVIGSACIAYVFSMNDMSPFSLTSQVEAGLPNITFPQFHITTDNQTFTIVDMVKELSSGIFVVPFIAILGNVAIAKSFAGGKVVDASQEMLAVGVCNLVGSCFCSMPVNASFSRAAVSDASGAKTPFGGIYTGVMVILALTFLTPYFSYIPKATLSSVVICAVIFMIEISIIKPMWKINKIDLIPLFVTFLVGLLLGLEIGILIGIAVDLLLLLYYSARPKVVVEKDKSEHGIEFIKITPSSALIFPSVEYVRELVMKSNLELGRGLNPIVIDCSKINRADYTAARCIGALVEDLTSRENTVIFLRLKPSLSKKITGTCKSKCSVLDTDGSLDEFLKGQFPQPTPKESKNGSHIPLETNLTTQL